MFLLTLIVVVVVVVVAAAAVVHLPLLLLSPYSGNCLKYHDKSRFSTEEVDNDMSSQNCAGLSGSSWWFNDCHQVLLSGTYGAYPGVDDVHGISWKEPWGEMKFANE